MEQERGVELDVGVEGTVGLVLPQQAQGGGFDAAGELVERRVAAAHVEALRFRGEHVGARIAHAVDAVAETHQTLAAGELLAQHRLGAVGGADLEDHVERGAGSAAVERPFESADCGAPCQSRRAIKRDSKRPSPARRDE